MRPRAVPPTRVISALATRNHKTPKRDAHMAPQVIVFLSCPSVVSIKDTCTTRPAIGVLKLSESATKSLLFRAYETLREQLKEFV